MEKRGHPEGFGNAAPKSFNLTIIPQPVEEHIAPLGGKSLQDGETDAAGGSGNDSGLSL